MDNINQYLTNITDSLDKLLYDDIQTYIGDYKKLNIYNNNIAKPLQKIWLLTPKLKMLGKIYIPNKQKQVALLTLILYELDSEIENFRNFLNDIEERIKKQINDMGYDNLTFRSSIKYSENFFPSITLQLPFTKKGDDIEFNFDIYSDKNKKIKLDDIESGSFIRAYIELCDIWLNNKDYGINWRVLQMKIYPEFDFKKCLFDDVPQGYNFIDPNHKKDDTTYNSNDQKLPKQKNNDQKSSISKPFIPSKDELLLKLNQMKLKKVTFEQPNINQVDRLTILEHNTNIQPIIDTEPITDTESNFEDSDKDIKNDIEEEIKPKKKKIIIKKIIRRVAVPPTN
jgi:hypothetical protein